MKKKTFVMIFSILMSVAFLMACGDDSQDTGAGTEPTVLTEASVATVATEAAATEAETSEATELVTEESKQTTETTEAGETTSATTMPATEPPTNPSETQVENTTETQPSEAAQEFSLNCVLVKLSQVGENAVIYSGAIDVKLIQWTTEDSAVATVADGVVTAVGAGKTKVYAEFGGVRKSCTVQCSIAEETVPPTTAPADPAAPVLAPPEYQSVSASFFDDALFIGDSVSEGLNNYCAVYGGLGNANFATKVSYGVMNEINGGLRVNLFGTPTRIEQIVAYYNPGKIFIMLGINELGYGIDTLMSNWGTYLSRIRSAAPNAQIYIQSVLPVYTYGENKSLGVTNANADALNARLREFALNNGCIYLDVAAYMKDSTGGLVRAYSSDHYVHLDYDGIRTWIKVLYAIVG